MTDRIDEALAAWRKATEHAEAPPGLADSVARAIDQATFYDALWSLGRRWMLVGAVAAAALVLMAAHSANTLAHESASYGLSGAL